MSGFAGIFHLDGAPVDRSWIEKLAGFLEFRGPDGRQIWISENAGLCHTLLRTSTETDGRPQIASLDGRLWIVGDVRVDDREALLAELLTNKRPCLKTSSSAELVLHAYDAWGESCLERILGDFSFIVWDARLQRVFCGRDHFGVRPLYYARVGQCVLISNTLESIRQIPIVSSELNDEMVADYLIVFPERDPGATYFASIRKLPAAHYLVANREGLRIQRYWTMPIEDPVYYRRSDDYTDRFLDLLRKAVRDRLPSGPVGVFMSGGLDSPAVAQAALHLGASPIAFTLVHDRLCPDNERFYAGLVAEHLKIPIRFRAMDDEPRGWDPQSPPIRLMGPGADPLDIAAFRAYHWKISQSARVFLTGEGPDFALRYEWRAHLRFLVQRRRIGRLCADLIFNIACHRRIPLVFTLPRMWRARQESNRPRPPFPTWINEEFATRHGLRRRWAEGNRPIPSLHPTRPEAYSSLTTQVLPSTFETMDASYTGAPIQYRHPYLDVRVLRFLLSVPVLPWCRNKYLIRRALRGLIPDEIRSRPKTRLQGSPEYEQAVRTPQPVFPRVPELGRYVRALPDWPGPDPREIDIRTRALSLHFWLYALQWGVGVEDQ